MFWMRTVIFIRILNKQMVNIERVTSKFEINELKEMIDRACGLYEF